MNFKDFTTTEDFSMDKDGIAIYFWFKGEQKSILANTAEKAAKLLLKNDLIDAYSGEGNDIEVEWTQCFSRIAYDNEYIREKIKHSASWKSFIEVFDLTAEDVVTIAAMEECEREANEVASVFDKIRDDITKIVSSVFL